jgi:malic enzyme
MNQTNTHSPCVLLLLLNSPVFLVAAEVLARLSTVDQLAAGMLFPPFAEITVISLKIAAEVAEYMIAQGYADKPADLAEDANMIDWLRPFMWKHVRHLTGKAGL